jgi:hypothetical protein
MKKLYKYKKIIALMELLLAVLLIIVSYHA